MRNTSSAMSLLVGVFVGIALVMSCDDDSPGNVDAAACDCPAAEPPIAGRITVVDNIYTIPANARGGQSTQCPAGAQLLSGSCTTSDVNPVRDVTLEQSGFYGSAPTGWTCLFKNNEAAPVTIKVSLICLMPSS